MNKEDKNLLYKDLCARLPYDVVCSVYEGSIDGMKWRNEPLCPHLLEEVADEDAWEYIKPYLRPMSSMTEEEENQFSAFRTRVKAMVNYHDFAKECNNLIGWLLKHHFDYNGLIEKGLAIKVIEENNPYK